MKRVGKGLKTYHDGSTVREVCFNAENVIISSLNTTALWII